MRLASTHQRVSEGHCVPAYFILSNFAGENFAEIAFSSSSSLFALAIACSLALCTLLYSVRESFFCLCWHCLHRSGKEGDLFRVEWKGKEWRDLCLPTPFDLRDERAKVRKKGEGEESLPAATSTTTTPGNTPSWEKEEEKETKAFFLKKVL